MKVHWNKVIGIVITTLSTLEICLLLSIISSNIKPDLLSLFVGLVGLVLGIGFLRGTYFEATPDRLILRGLIGPARRTYPLTSGKTISIVGARLFFTEGEKRQRLPIYAWMANKKDWEAFIRWLQTKN